MPDITWEQPFCQDSGNCFRIGTDAEGNAHIAVAGREEHRVTDSVEALRMLIRDIKAGKADHLL
ncbi:hypothetical protein DMB38_15870 [Streptomyces sp. WAC 06738]|uniref:hypothetical protein n=1 Tax=Streptomyces sp. WAC 06738 TaxID=2203210 RepID=UPI000F6EEF94|nr:hypothetical protein [Streptomyces sp. WAC 06738]AZM47086.1 hypothetical protein DMB38_15870 [Streptomyces sp. WAC 06738]